MASNSCCQFCGEGSGQAPNQETAPLPGNSPQNPLHANAVVTIRYEPQLTRSRRGMRLRRRAVRPVQPEPETDTETVLEMLDESGSKLRTTRKIHPKDRWKYRTTLQWLILEDSFCLLFGTLVFGAYIFYLIKCLY